MKRQVADKMKVAAEEPASPVSLSEDTLCLFNKKRRAFFNGLVLLLLFLCAFVSTAGERKKVGLVLGGGGAKGVAHIGVIKVLEEAGIPIDYITGTSIGAIVGGLYAIGYTPAAIDSMVLTQDWGSLLADRVKRNNLLFPQKENAERYILSVPFLLKKKEPVFNSMIKGQNLQNLFSDLTIGFHGEVDFSHDLKIPFSCVAVNLVDGKDYVFHKGSLALAMEASMAIPAVFSPVRIDSAVLVDGGLNNNFPVDVARAMGADIIIGVDLGTSDLKEIQDLNTPVEIIAQIAALHGYDKYCENKKNTDLLLRPNVKPYTSASFNVVALDTLICRGEQAAYSQWEQILALKAKIGLPDPYRPSGDSLRRYVSHVHALDTFRIEQIHFSGADPRDMGWLRKVTKLKENSRITMAELRQAMSILVGTNVYANVGYKLLGSKDAYDLELSLTPKSNTAFNVGGRFDTEEIVAVMLNGTFDYRAYNHSRLAFTGRVGKTTSARLDYTIERNPLRNFNLAYQFTYQDLSIYHKGKKTNNTTYKHHFAELSYSDMNWLNFKFKAGLRYEYYDYNSFLYTSDEMNFTVKPHGYISYFAMAHLETLDRRYFPNRGVFLQADYSIYTDNFVGFKGGAPFSAAALKFSTVLPLNSRLCLLPSVYGRVLMGGNAEYPYLNMVGGETFGKYRPFQLPFAGINHVEIFDNAVLIGGLQLRYRIGGRHYLSLVGNYAIHHDDLLNITKGKSVWGGSFGYAYNSLVGPLSITFSMSDRSDIFQFYMNLGYSF